jgi:anti-sigma-K factor RskA
MRLRGDRVQDALAAEYALGTLRGPGRRRFERLLREDAGLRDRTLAWHARLAPLDNATAPVAPPARVWRGIEARITPSAPPRGERSWWDSLRFWRGAALAGFLAAAAFGTTLALKPREPEMMVVVMSDESEQPRLTVSWRMDDRGQKRLRVRVIGHAEMAPDTAWELWAVPRGEGRPVSLGLITTHATQTVVVPDRLADMIDAAQGLAMSVEPRGGSPTGLPSGPVLYKGPCTQI